MVFWSSSLQRFIGQSTYPPLSVNRTWGRGSVMFTLRIVIHADALSSGESVVFMEMELLLTLMMNCND